MTTGVISLLTFFVGLLLGHWLAIGRDKRKEFNECSIPIREWLLRIKEAPTPFDPLPSALEIDRFAVRLCWWKRSAFYKHLEKYKQAHDAAIIQDPKTGALSYNDSSEIKRELKSLFSYTNEK